MASFLGELRRRNVFRVGAAYAVVAWLLIQIAATVLPAFELPAWILQSFLVLIGLGFPVTLVLAWIFDLTPEGVKRTDDVNDESRSKTLTGRKLDFAIIGLLGVAILFLIIDDYVLDGRTGAIATSVAVLPFNDLSPERDQEYFSDGISEELLNTLATIPRLRVPSRTSSFSFKGKRSDLQTIAAALDVEHVLEGSVRKEGSRIRVSAQLIDVATDSPMWTETYDRELTNTFTVQDEIAASVAEILRVRLLGAKDPERDGRRTDNVAAHDAYLFGRHHLATRLVDDLRIARSYFEQAIELDPRYAIAHVGLADALALLFDYGGIEQDELIRNARPLIDRALELDPEIGEAYATRGFLLRLTGNAAESEQDFRRAIALSPNYASAYRWYGYATAVDLGRLEEGLDLYRKALELDPLSPATSLGIGNLSLFTHDFDAARAQYERARQAEPTYPYAHFYLGWLEFLDGNVAEGLRLARHAAELDRSSPLLAAYVGLIYIALEDLEAAEQWLQRSAELFGDSPRSPFFRDFVSLVVRKEDPERLVSHMKNLPRSNPLAGWPGLLRHVYMQTGDVDATRSYYRRWWPDLLTDADPSVGPHNFPAAIDIAALMLDDGEDERARNLLERSLAVLREIPHPSYQHWYIEEVQALALLGQEAEALAALREAIDNGWRVTWWQVVGSPTLAAIADHPEFVAMMNEIRADMAQQRSMVRED